MLVVRPTSLHFDVERLRADIARISLLCPFYETGHQISLCHRPASAALGPVERFRDGVGRLAANDAGSEADFTELHEEVRDTYLGDVYRAVQKAYPNAAGRYRIRRMPPHRCLSWHVDDGVKYHIPITTHEHAFFVTRFGIYRMTDVGRLHIVRTDIYHTAINADPSRERVVLVVDGVPDRGALADGRRKLFRRVSQ